MSYYQLTAAKHAQAWVIFFICFAILLGGCQAKTPPLSTEAQDLKQELLKDMDQLTTALSEPVAQQDWEAAKPILQKSFMEMERDKLAPYRIVVLDRNAVTQVRFPAQKEEQFDYSNYKQTRPVFSEKKKTQFMAFRDGKKLFGLIAPILQQGNINGAVAIAFNENELISTWKVSEKEFTSIDFNR